MKNCQYTNYTTSHSTLHFTQCTLRNQRVPGRVVVVVGGDGDVDDAARLVEGLLEGVQTHVRDQALQGEVGGEEERER